MLKLAPTPLVQQLLEALRTLPGAEIRAVRQEPKSGARTRGYDAVVDLQLGTRPLTLLVEEKRSVYPRDVQQLLWQLTTLQNPVPHAAAAADIVPLLAAESLSAGAAQLLRSEGIAYFDSGGSLFMPTPGAYVFLDKPPSRNQASAMRSLFSGKRSQAIHGLLLRRSEWFGVNELAALALVSAATASGVLSELEKFDWVMTRGQGPRKQRQLREPGALLDAWASQVTSERSQPLHRYFVPAIKPDVLVDRAAKAFEGHHADYTVTHDAAAQRYAPFLSHVGQVRCRALMTPQTEAALAELGARPVNEGANLCLIEVQSTGEMLFPERLGKALLASPVHVYLDLLGSEGRAREMAQHLRQERLGF